MSLKKTKIIIDSDKTLHLEDCKYITGKTKKCKTNVFGADLCRECEQMIWILQGDNLALENQRKYEDFFKEIPRQLIKKFYENHGKTKWWGNFLFLHYGEDDWKIDTFNKELFHNNYAVSKGIRYAKSGYHCQKTVSRNNKSFLETIMWYKPVYHLERKEQQCNQ